MIKLLRFGVLVFSFAALSMPLLAQNNSERAFETFKSLNGRWAIESNGKTLPIEMRCEVGSKESIVTEQFGKELSVIYLDGKNLLITHFCNADNQPRLRLKESGQPGVLEFEMFDITNLKDASTPNVQRIVYKITDGRTMTLEIIWKKGQSEESEKYTLSRILRLLPSLCSPSKSATMQPMVAAFGLVCAVTQGTRLNNENQNDPATGVDDASES